MGLAWNDPSENRPGTAPYELLMSDSSIVGHERGEDGERWRVLHFPPVGGGLSLVHTPDSAPPNADLFMRAFTLEPSS